MTDPETSRRWAAEDRRAAEWAAVGRVDDARVEARLAEGVDVWHHYATMRCHRCGREQIVTVSHTKPDWTIRWQCSCFQNRKGCNEMDRGTARGVQATNGRGRE